MHPRRLVTFLLGFWLAGSLFMTTVATQNFRQVDRVLSGPPRGAQAALQQITPAAAHSLLRYEASEMNRHYFEFWEWMQVVLGASLLALLLTTGGRRWHVLTAAAALLIVLFFRFYLTPEIVTVGRMIDFVPYTTPSPQRDYFWKLHPLYSSLEVGKLLLLTVLTAAMLWLRPEKSAQPVRRRRSVAGAHPAS